MCPDADDAFVYLRLMDDDGVLYERIELADPALDFRLFVLRFVVLTVLGKISV